MTGVTKVNATWPAFANFAKMAYKHAKHILALGINGRIGYLQLKK